MQYRIALMTITGILFFISVPLEANSRDSITWRRTYEDLRAVPHVLAIGDINNDESPEILFASTNSRLVILEEDLSQGPVKPMSSAVREILLSDLDGDYFQDIIAIDSTTLYIFDKDLNDKFKYVFEGEVFDIAVGDLDNDDLDEILVGTSSGLDAFSWDAAPSLLHRGNSPSSRKQLEKERAIWKK